jgi:hypothetical protein
MDTAVDVFEERLNKMDANREKSKAIAQHQGVPKEEAAEEPIGTQEDGYKARYLVLLRRQPKKRTQGDGESLMNLTAIHRRRACHAVSARCKGRGHEGRRLRRDDVRTEKQ